MADERRLDTVSIELDGKGLDKSLTDRLLRVEVEQSVLLADRFEFTLDDHDFEVFDKGSFLTGMAVKIGFRAEHDPIPVIEGDIVQVWIRNRVDNGGGPLPHELVVSGYDRTHRLTRSVPPSQDFAKMTGADIVQDIARRHGLDAEVASGGAKHASLLQAGQSDYDFLRELADLEGVDFWVSGKTLHYARRPSVTGEPPTLTYGGNLTRFGVRFSSADRCDQMIVRGYDSTAQRPITGSSEEVERGTTAPAAGQMAAQAQQAFGRVVRNATLHGAYTQEEAAAAAESLMNRACGAEVVMTGEVSGDPRLTAGAKVRVEGVGTQLAGSYQLTDVTHVLTPGEGYVTRFTSGGKDPLDVVGLLHPAAAPAIGGAIAGGGAGGGGGGLGTRLVVGTVTTNKDADRLGRVKVTLPNLGSKHESPWAEVVSAGAGKSRGAQWLPEKGDQVLVGFKNGNVNQPVVLGGVWSMRTPPPSRDAGDGGTTKVRVLQTGKGHRIELTDAPDSTIVIALGDSAGTQLTLKRDATSLTGEMQLRISAKQVEVNGEQSLSLTGGLVQVSAKGVLTLSGQQIVLKKG